MMQGMMWCYVFKPAYKAAHMRCNCTKLNIGKTSKRERVVALREKKKKFVACSVCYTYNIKAIAL